MSITSESFWEFSLAFYAQPDIQQACLNLQNTQHADVNILLFLLYLARHKKQLSKASIQSIEYDIKAWREEIIQPIRHIRRQLKQRHYALTQVQQEQFRQSVMTLELESERLEQIQLESMDFPSSTAPATQAAQNNLKHYATLLHANAHQDFETLIKCFQNTN